MGPYVAKRRSFPVAVVFLVVGVLMLPMHAQAGNPPRHTTYLALLLEKADSLGGQSSNRIDSWGAVHYKRARIEGVTELFALKRNATPVAAVAITDEWPIGQSPEGHSKILLSIVPSLTSDAKLYTYDLRRSQRGPVLNQLSVGALSSHTRTGEYNASASFGGVACDVVVAIVTSFIPGGVIAKLASAVLGVAGSAAACTSASIVNQHTMTIFDPLTSQWSEHATQVVTGNYWLMGATYTYKPTQCLKPNPDTNSGNVFSNRCWQQRSINTSDCALQQHATTECFTETVRFKIYSIYPGLDINNNIDLNHSVVQVQSETCSTTDACSWYSSGHPFTAPQAGNYKVYYFNAEDMSTFVGGGFCPAASESDCYNLTGWADETYTFAFT
jgi:hypothetical protein